MASIYIVVANPNKNLIAAFTIRELADEYAAQKRVEHLRKKYRRMEDISYDSYGFHFPTTYDIDLPSRLKRFDLQHHVMLSDYSDEELIRLSGVIGIGLTHYVTEVEWLA